MYFDWFVCEMIEGVLVAGVDENVSDFCRNQVVVEGNVASDIINLDHFDLLGDGISTTVVFAILSPILFFVIKYAKISIQLKSHVTFRRILLPVDTGPCVSASMTFNFITFFPMLPLLGMSRNTRYSIAINEAPKALAMSSGGCN